MIPSGSLSAFLFGGKLRRGVFLRACRFKVSVSGFRGEGREANVSTG